MLGHKTSLNKIKRIEIISRMFSDHNGMKLEINYRKKNGKSKNMWRLKMSYWKNSGSMKKSENDSRKMKMDTQLSKIYGNQQKQF